MNLLTIETRYTATGCVCGFEIDGPATDIMQLLQYNLAVLQVLIGGNLHTNAVQASCRAAMELVAVLKHFAGSSKVQRDAYKQTFDELKQWWEYIARLREKSSLSAEELFGSYCIDDGSWEILFTPAH